MSCYMVSKETIDEIVWGFKKYDGNLIDNFNNLGESLVAVNQIAVGDEDLENTYRYEEPRRRNQNLSTLYGCIECWLYQTDSVRDTEAIILRSKVDRLKEIVVVRALNIVDNNAHIAFGI